MEKSIRKFGTGREPGVGSFRYQATEDDWAIAIVFETGERVERYCSLHHSEPGNNLGRVYEILREHGFTVGN